MAVPQRRECASNEGQVAAVALTISDMYLRGHAAFCLNIAQPHRNLQHNPT